MATALYIDTANTFNSGSQYLLTSNPMQPRGMVKNQPSTPFNTIAGPGGVQAPKVWYPNIVFTWPSLVKSNANHALLLAAFEERQYVKTGVNHFIGILAGASKDAGYPFWNAAKFIEIRIMEVQSAEHPVDTDINQVIYDMIVTAKWMDPD